MGCLCSKEAVVDEIIEEATYFKEADPSKSSVQLVAPSNGEEIALELNGVGNDGSGEWHQQGLVHNHSSHHGSKGKGSNVAVERPGSSHHPKGPSPQSSRISSPINSIEAEQIAAGWPSWLTSVAAEAIQGMVPRRVESFKKLKVIGKGTYSCVYKAHDLETNKFVALKKIRFSSMDQESVRFMAREILILRKLDHPNIIKLEGIVTSMISGSLYLVFEYMDHDLAGILSRPGIKLSEAQIKCYMQQLLSGLEHSHGRGILHRDIKGSNILISGDGVLKIGDWGLANFCQQQPLTSRVVTLWYRAPELLLGATKYGVGVDLWSAGCILAELFTGEPILPGRTEVEQLHKILKLCGSPSEDYWWKSLLPHATSFKPQVQYKRRVAEKFKDVSPAALSLIENFLSLEPKDRGSAAAALGSDFFTTWPFPCDRSSLPKLPPSKEIDAKHHEQESKRQKTETVKGRGPESVRRGLRDIKGVPTPEFDAHREVSLQGKSNSKGIGHKFHDRAECGSGFPVEPLKGTGAYGFSQTSSMLHPSAAGSSIWASKVSLTRHNKELKTQTSFKPHHAAELRTSSHTVESDSRKDSSLDYNPKNVINYSGPLVPPGGNLDDMLKEHERQIQQAVRSARLEKNKTSKING